MLCLVSTQQWKSPHIELSAFFFAAKNCCVSHNKRETLWKRTSRKFLHGSPVLTSWRMWRNVHQIHSTITQPQMKRLCDTGIDSMGFSLPGDDNHIHSTFIVFPLLLTHSIQLIKQLSKSFKEWLECVRAVRCVAHVVPTTITESNCWRLKAHFRMN